MQGYINEPLMLVAKFPPTKAGLATVGYTLHNPDGTVYVARTTARNDVGNGRYTATPTIADAWRGYVVWDTGDASPLEAEEEIIVVPAPVSATDPRLDNLPVDLSPVLNELGNPAYGLAANMALLVDADAEVDIIHDAIGLLGTALSAGLATETTQQAILNLVTPNVPADHVFIIPAAAEPGMQTLYGRTRDSAGVLAANITVTATLNGVNVIDNDFLIKQVLSAESGNNGQWALTLVCSARYNIEIPGHGKTYQNLKITSAASATLASYVTPAVAP